MAGHTKNFAFRLKKEGVRELAPACEVCHAYRPELAAGTSVGAPLAGALCIAT